MHKNVVEKQKNHPKMGDLQPHLNKSKGVPFEIHLYRIDYPPL